MTKKEYLKQCEGFWDKCLDCNGENHPYMIKFWKWRWLVPKRDRKKVICIPCIEKRLGRALKLSDFLDAPINWGVMGFDAKVYCNLKGNKWIS